MPAKNLLRVTEKGAYLHVYNKGIDNRVIFSDTQDYDVFLAYLKEYLSETLDLEVRKKSFTVKGKTYRGTPHQPKNYFGRVELIAYSLLPNHFHLILHQRVEGALESFLRSLCTRYSIYYNKRHHRQGALFEGPYKSAHITDTKLLLHLVSYIHKAHGTEGLSSESIYFGENKVGWVESSVILSMYGDAENNHMQAASGFKKFASKHVITEAERNYLASVIIEKDSTNLERRILNKDLTSEPVLVPQKKEDKKKANKIRRIPEYLTLFLIFIILFGLGFRNITINTIMSEEANMTGVQDTSTDEGRLIKNKNVAFEEVSSIDTKKEVKESTEVLSATDSSQINFSEIDPLSLIYSVLVVKQGAVEVNIYKEPNSNSELVTTVHEGETIIATPVDSEWYEVRFSDEAKGYVLAEYVTLQSL